MFEASLVRGLRPRAAGSKAKARSVGSGGGLGDAASLAAGGVAAIDLFDIHAKSAERLAARLRQHYPRLQVSTGSNDPASCDLVINATPLGMNDDDPLPIDASRIAPTAFVGEVVMKKETTAFLAAARARGCRIQIGTDMLFEQIPAYLEFFGFPAITPEELRAVAKLSY